jgi:6-phosphogluconolactonase
MSDLETRIFKNRDDLVSTAAQMIAQKLENLSSLQKDIHIAITGGTVGILTLEALRRQTKAMDLSRLHIWWVDERFVPRESSDRNELQARKSWLEGSGIVEKNIHAFPASDSTSIEHAARSFASEIEGMKPDFDLVLLGMGEDGHVASLFPGSEVMAFGNYVVVEENSPKPPKVRLSLSMNAINSAKEVMFLVSGIEKAQAVSNAISGVGNLPAGDVSGLNSTLWLLDEDAASMITSS